MGDKSTVIDYEGLIRKAAEALREMGVSEAPVAAAGLLESAGK